MIPQILCRLTDALKWNMQQEVSVAPAEYLPNALDAAFLEAADYREQMAFDCEDNQERVAKTRRWLAVYQ